MLLFALGQIGSPEAASTLLKFFASSVHTVRAAAVEALGKLQVPALTKPVLEILEKDPSPFVGGFVGEGRLDSGWNEFS